ncbi:glutaredoxin family protein [Radiobacillus kanasensis]|uniref:glutaredoxin family protein n=1 Tax=Radiobacillus kanasensis TaxID=2844358 RepID=UPI001E348B66|nr:glutaredoxin family protein [Radiobacillus kanasensis]UFT98473.1 glutaredoxin family protein [Radiobacillus kanasensis]
MKEVLFYTKRECHLCEEAKLLLELFQDDLNITIREIDIYEDDEILEKYQLMIPVLEHDGEVIDYGRIDIDRVKQVLNIG